MRDYTSNWFLKRQNILQIGDLVFFIMELRDKVKIYGVYVGVLEVRRLIC